jgi:hypothetical protein
MKSLGAIVRPRSLGDLRAIAELWGIASPHRGDIDEAMQIERIMREPIAARTVWESLGYAERMVLQAIVGPAARNWCPVEQLAERSGLDEESAQAALQHLRESFLVDIKTAKMQGNELVGQRNAFYGYVMARPAQDPVVERQIAYVPTEIATTLYATGRELNGVPADRTTLSLDDLLMPYRQGDLDQIGKRFNLTLQTYCSRNEVRSVIAQNVSQANAVRYALEQIDPTLKDLYEWLIARGGRAKADEVRCKMGWDVPTYLQAVRTFEEYAIAFDAFSDGQRVIFIPAATFDNLRRASARPHKEIGLRERSTPRAICPADSIILWDMAALVSLVAQQEVELTRAQVLPKRAAQRLLSLMTNDLARQHEDFGYRYLTQLQYEALELGIIQTVLVDGHTRLELSDKIETWAGHDCRMQTYRILRRWTHNRNWQDHAGAHYRPWMSHYISISSAREAMMQVLRNCDPGIWYDTASLLQTIQGDNPFVLRPNQRFNSQGGFKMTDEVRSHWDQTDGEILVGMLSSTLYELGIVSLGYDAEAVPAARNLANPDAFMLTELGAEVLKNDLGRAYVAADKALILQPSFEILLMEPHMPALYWLIRFTQVEQIGRASRFRLTREALLRALSAGFTLDDIIAFLARYSQIDLAQNVVYTLRDWARQYKETRLSNVILIEVDSEELATELCASMKLRDLGLRRVGPRALATPEGKALRTVRRAIERAGYATQKLDRAAMPSRK